MKKITAGIVAPVDAGKTTLTEAWLYETGTVRKLGRVDHGDAFLDPGQLEKRRGITIAAHQAILKQNEFQMTILDTPGHVDFAAATEQVLQVLDYAFLLISATDGVTGTVRFLWRLLQRSNVPTFIFVNKMDAPGADKANVLHLLQQELSPNCVDFTGAESKMTAEVADNVAAVDEATLESYLDSGKLPDATTVKLINQRKVFPVHFGAALQQSGTSELLTSLEHWTTAGSWPDEFSAHCFKISHTTKGERLTWLRVTGGTLHAKDELLPGQKVDSLRIYNGTKFDTVTEVRAGDTCAVLGPTDTYPGLSLGVSAKEPTPIVHPVIRYGVNPGNNDISKVQAALSQLADEDPSINIDWDADNQQLHVALVGTVQRDILQQRLADEFNLTVSFDVGRIMYAETITKKVEGVGHFEPLRHYAEVHLLLEPGLRGSGIQLANQCRVEVLPKNWQHQIMTALTAKTHRGVLIGAPLTDIKITLLGGRGNIVHSVGGDFRQATWRAVRQGLMELGQDGCQLLEPWYRFRLSLDSSEVGRAITDVSQMGGTMDDPQTDDRGHSVLTGMAPVSAMFDYAAKVRTYTHGEGQLEMVVAGYRKCHNADEVIADAKYDAKSDLPNTPDSVFCAHGAGYPVDWDAVPSHMHVPYYSDFMK